MGPAPATPSQARDRKGTEFTPSLQLVYTGYFSCVLCCNFAEIYIGNMTALVTACANHSSLLYACGLKRGLSDLSSQYDSRFSLRFSQPSNKLLVVLYLYGFPFLYFFSRMNVTMKAHIANKYDIIKTMLISFSLLKI